MPKIHTHYDNLKVTRDAPPEVIRAAYQALSRKYHPDKNSGDVASQRVMSLINAAYELLSDPQKREQHDRWIRSMESDPANVERPIALTPVVALDPTEEVDPVVAPRRPTEKLPRPWLSYVLVAILVALLAALFVPSLGLRMSPVEARVDSSVIIETPGPSVAPSPTPNTATSYVRPGRAPSGEPWPSGSNYIAGFKQLFNDGLSTVTVDNSPNQSDVYVKLYVVREPRSFAVRWVYVRGRDTFVIRDLRPGRYDLRYRDLDSGLVTRTEPFDLKESPVAEGTRFTQVKLSLQKPKPGERANLSAFDPDF